MGAGLPIIQKQKGICKIGEKVTLKFSNLNKAIPIQVLHKENSQVNINQNTVEITPIKTGKSLVKVKYHLNLLEEPDSKGPVEGPLYYGLIIELNVKKFRIGKFKLFKLEQIEDYEFL